MDSIQRAAQDRSQIPKSFLPNKGSLLLLTAGTIGIRILTKTSLPAAVGGGLVITLVSRCLWKKCASTPIVTLFFAVFCAQYPGDVLRAVSSFLESSQNSTSAKQNLSSHVRQGVPVPPNMPRPSKRTQGGSVVVYHPLSDMIQNHRLAVMMLRGTNWQLSRMSYHISGRCHRLFQPFGLPLRTLILVIDRFWQFFRGSPDSIVDRLYLNTLQNQRFSEEQASSFYRNLSSILTPDQKRKLAEVLEKNTSFKEELKNPKNHQKLLFDQSEDSIELTDEQRKELFPTKAQSKQYRPMIQQTLIHPNDQSKLPSQVKSYQICGISPHGAIEIHNNAMFQIHPGDMHKASHWNISDHITFSPNSSILGDSEYFITNSTQKGEPVRANLSRGPFYDNPATTRFEEIDHKKCEVVLKNGHGDIHRFAVEQGDMHRLKSCKLGETAMVGTNDSSLLSWLLSSPPLMLTSYENGEFFLYVRCTHKSSTMGNRANNSGSETGS